MFRPATGLRYYRFLNQLHATLLFDWYLEVGCRKGDSLAPVRGKTIAVDPFFRTKINVIGQKAALYAFQFTSDDFFAAGVLERNNIRLGLSFLDGMHQKVQSLIALSCSARPASTTACCQHE